MFHPKLKHLFLVGDEGTLVELDTTPKVLRVDKVKGNLEEVTVHTPTGTPLCQGHGLFSHYRVFTRGKRYGGGAWDWPSESKLRDDGSVEVRWPAADGEVRREGVIGYPPKVNHD